MNFPIDLVYLWVDGNDTVWRAKKDKYMKQAGLLHKDAKTDARFRDNDELRYALRSAHMFAPWINHIYIVTDGQVPKWLNTKHPKISIIDHKQIMPADALPTFNSGAIASCVDNIPALAEHFLLANDDTFFGREHYPYDFFSLDGFPINVVKPKPKENLWTDAGFSKAIAGKRGLHGKKLMLVQKLVYEKTGKKYYCWPSHNLEPFRKSHFTEIKSLFPKEIRTTIYNRFRKPDDILTFIYILYNNALGRGHLTLHKKYGAIPDSCEPGDYRGLNKKTLVRLVKSIFIKPQYFTMDGRQIIHAILKYKPFLFCINDASANGERALQNNRKFFESYFPNKSEFEL
ncbi:MAG: stealth family protein [Alphaproteobacteria bacterium]|nr:stealth family protein [Alphaproteobacteria bacterium]